MADDSMGVRAHEYYVILIHEYYEDRLHEYCAGWLHAHSAFKLVPTLLSGHGFAAANRQTIEESVYYRMADPLIIDKRLAVVKSHVLGMRSIAEGKHSDETQTL